MLPSLQQTRAGTWPDAWLIQILLDRSVIHQEDLEAILDARERTAWLSLTRSGLATDDAILAALSGRFAMPLADLGEIESSARSLL